ncbi:MAG: 3'-5' exonuclease [Crocinitomicaceae bacterium]
MNLQLSKPLCFFDLETTGINITQDRIVEISILKIMPDQSKATYTKRMNPTIPIPKQASEIHGIWDKDVANEPTFAELAKEIRDFFEDGDLAGYNSDRFDIPLLVEEFMRTDVDFEIEKRKTIDVQTIFHKMEQRTLSAAYKFYCDKELIDAHSAEADTTATFEVLTSQLDKYENLENNIDFLADFTVQGGKSVDFAKRIVRNDKDQVVFNFGKHKGVPVEKVFDLEPSYYSWMLNGDFPAYTKKVLRDLFEVYKQKKTKSQEITDDKLDQLKNKFNNK